MGKGKAPFSLYKRPSSVKEAKKKRQGKKYKFYYYVSFRDSEGNYTSGLSTGETSKGAANKWAYDYLKKGNVPTNRGFTFEKYAKDWWTPEKCEYLKEKERMGHKLSARYVLGSRRNLENHLIPYFGQKKITSITFNDVRKWMFYLCDEKGLNPATANRCLAVLKVMLKQAVRMGYIQSNPCKDFGIFKENPKTKTVLNIEEFTQLFDESKIQNVWENDFYMYTANLLSATTGMRQGEILALQRRYVHIDRYFIEVVHSWSRKFGLKDTKNHQKRVVPISYMTGQYLRSSMESSIYKEPHDLVFHGSFPDKPLDFKRMNDSLYHALEQIGISTDERKSRNISFHSWRYFFNTHCRSQGIADFKIRAVMGHKTMQMTERYTNINMDDLKDVKQIQEDFFIAAKN